MVGLVLAAKVFDCVASSLEVVRQFKYDPDNEPESLSIAIFSTLFTTSVMSSLLFDVYVFRMLSRLAQYNQQERAGAVER
mgnify:CR=1 FL=1